MPLSYFIGIYLGYGCPGMFVGLAIGNYILVLFYAAIAFRKDWDIVA
jgi:Na+-driven multidrug efflux pump